VRIGGWGDERKRREGLGDGMRRKREREVEREYYSSSPLCRASWRHEFEHIYDLINIC